MTQTVFRPESHLQVAEKIFKTSIPGLWYIAHNKHEDARGYFSEITIIDDLNAVLNQPFSARQINVAYSQTNVSRGFHTENWNKLITLVQGTAFCAIADLRQESPTYKMVESFILGESPDALSGSLYISKGLANSYCITQGPANYLYLVDVLYRERSASSDAAISLFDPDLAVSWPIPKDQMIISDRDLSAKTLQEIM